ncbi:Uncharacterized protein ORF8 in nfe locus [Neochlamydia sp. EPS4]|uniref:transposase n=1 Tax=Neochlamydia sp. EPS4 TaxID=1478175 RepID=UPI0005828ABF|nr:transposase [Neochlamydia sp. EPS4]KIC75615.1 Uncharacterized protein ORF8 in nfe locus [Neochlamydia sp. EPS4]
MKAPEEEFDKLFAESVGQPAKSVRLVMGLLILQHMCEISNENILDKGVDTSYRQYFCVYAFWHHAVSIHPTSLIKWRHRLGEAGLITGSI